MLDIAPSTRDALSGKLQSTARLSGIASAGLLGKADLLANNEDLFRVAEEACPHLPAVRCNQIIGFYFTAGLAAAEMTPPFVGRQKMGIEVDAPGGSGQKMLIYASPRQFPADLRPPRAPRFSLPSFAATELLGNPSTLERFELKVFTQQAHDRRRSHFHAADKPMQIEPFRAFTELKQLLRLSAAQLAELLGIRRTTPNAWHREGRRPRGETELRLYRLHRYVSDLAGQPDGAERLARIRPMLPLLTNAIYAEAAISSETLDAAKVGIPFDWQKINSFQSRTRLPVLVDEEGQDLGDSPSLEGMVIEEDEDDLDLRY